MSAIHTGISVNIAGVKRKIKINTNAKILGAKIWKTILRN